MDQGKLDWKEYAPGITVLKLYSEGLIGDEPRIIILHLTPERFREFERDPLAFDRTYRLYDRQPTLWATQCVKPPIGKGIPRWEESTNWTVCLVHGKQSCLTSAAMPWKWVDAAY